MGVSCFPCRPMVTAATGWTSTIPPFDPAARSLMRRTTDASSIAGFVFGMQQTPVKPPAAAARVPDSIVSLYSYPGSRRGTCMSMKPGSISAPPRFLSSPPFEPLSRAPIFSISPFCMRRSTVSSLPVSGSTSLPFLSSKFIRTLSSGRLRSWARAEKIEHRHPNCHPVQNLCEYQGMLPVGHVGGDLDIPIDRARMQYRYLSTRALQAPARDSEVLMIFAEAGEKKCFLAFQLETQHVENVGIADCVIDPMVHTDSERLNRPGNQRARPAYRS